MPNWAFRIDLVIAAASTFLLAACFGNGPDSTAVATTEDVAPTVARTGSAANYAFVYQPTGGTPDRVLRTQSNSGWYYYPDTLAGIPSKFKTYRQSSEGFLLRGTSDSGSGEVIVVDNGAQLTRHDPTVLPTVGSATYSGSYGAIVVNGIRDMSPKTVSGKATLQVDFKDQNVSGAITDRIYDGVTPSQDVTLNTSSMSGGAFTGTTTGGDLNTSGLTAANGSYTGLLVGPNGEEAIGAVTIIHSNGSSTFTEQGGFVANQ